MPMMDLTRKQNNPFIEDIARACGGTYKGRKLGSIGMVGCLSFHAVENLTTGDDGMISVHNPEFDN